MKIQLLLFSIMIFSSCRDKKTETLYPISKISYTIINGGKPGYNSSLIISSDSMKYLEKVNGVVKIYWQKVSKNLWDSLNIVLNLSDFDKIESGLGKEASDGTDTTVSFEKGGEIHSFTNGQTDAMHYKKISAFMYLIETQLARCEHKAQ